MGVQYSKWPGCHNAPDTRPPMSQGRPCARLSPSKRCWGRPGSHSVRTGLTQLEGRLGPMHSETRINTLTVHCVSPSLCKEEKHSKEVQHACIMLQCSQTTDCYLIPTISNNLSANSLKPVCLPIKQHESWTHVVLLYAFGLGFDHNETTESHSDLHW